MVAEARLKSKNLYKVELYLLKIMPMVIALAYLVNTVSSYFGVDIPILASIAGMSLIPLIFMYISSYVFKFCEYHRMFLHYIAVNDIINIYDWYIGISVTNRELFVLHMSITGISLFIILYLYVKSHKKLTNIDAGNSNITEGEAIEIVDNLRRFTDKEKRLSKYAACKYLNVSRATFDNYVRSGKLPRGEHEAGFKELSWNKKTLDEFIRRSKHEK